MKIIKITPSTVEFIETDDDTYPTYRRSPRGIWENLLGLSWVSVYDSDGLEKEYKRFKELK